MSIHYVWLLASVLLSSVAHLALKIGALRLGSGGDFLAVTSRLAANGWLMIGVTLHVLALALWVTGLRHIPLTVAYPIIALGFVFVSLLSWMFLNEHLGAVRVTGMILITSGVVLIART